MADGRTLTASGAPPLLLALETATPAVSVALLRGEEVLAERRAAPGPASETLLVAIDALLRGAQVEASGLEAFAVSIGPGSFTRLRVGIATAKGLAFGTGRPVAAVSSLAALARAAPRHPSPPRRIPGVRGNRPSSLRSGAGVQPYIGV